MVELRALESEKMDMLIFKRAAVVCLALAVLTGCSNGRLTSNPIFDIALDRVGLGGKDEAAAAPASEGPPKGPPLIVGFQTNRTGKILCGDRWGGNCHG